MAGRYPSYDDYFRQPNPTPAFSQNVMGQANTGAGLFGSIDFDAAAKLAERAMATVLSSGSGSANLENPGSMESQMRGEIGMQGPFSQGPNYGNRNDFGGPQQGYTYRREVPGIQREFDQYSSGQSSGPASMQTQQRGMEMDFGYEGGGVQMQGGWGRPGSGPRDKRRMDMFGYGDDLRQGNNYGNAGDGQQDDRRMDPDPYNNPPQMNNLENQRGGQYRDEVLGNQMKQGHFNRGQHQQFDDGYSGYQDDRRGPDRQSEMNEGNVSQFSSEGFIDNPNQRNLQGQVGRPNQGNIQDQVGRPNQGNIQDQVDRPNQRNSQGQVKTNKSTPQNDPDDSASKKPDLESSGDGCQKAEDSKDNEESSDDEDTSFCKLCKLPFDTPVKFFRHTRGLLHTQRQMAHKAEKAGKTLEEMYPAAPPEPQPFKFGQGNSSGPGATLDPKAPAQNSSVQMQPAAADSQGLALIGGADEEAQEEEEGDWWEEEDENEFTCELCDIKTTGAVTLRTHINGRNHKLVQEALDKGTPVPQRIISRLGPKSKVFEKLNLTFTAKTVPSTHASILMERLADMKEGVVGLRLVKEIKTATQQLFMCTVCHTQCDLAAIQAHIVGAKHRMKYLRDHKPEIYEHVRTHGGKRSQLTSFLEEVCKDVEMRDGRGEPIKEQEEKNEKEEKEKKEKEEKKQEEASAAATAAAEAKKGSPTPGPPKKLSKEEWGYGRNLPHDVVMARYKEDQMRRQTMDRVGPPPPGFDRYADPSLPPPPSYGSIRRPPSPIPFMSEEERLHRMYEYERRNFYNPDLTVEPEEVRRRMFAEYERLGVPYPTACDRVLMQERRIASMLELLRQGLNPEDARRRVVMEENRRSLIREYEQMGLTSRQARWRVVVEEERTHLFERYERLGVDPFEARNRIMAGDDRLYLIKAFERQGMSPEEARSRALAEESRLRNFEDSMKKGLGGEGAAAYGDQRLDDVAEERMLSYYMEQGLAREDAENKVIAQLRKQGMQTREAILRVQKIKVNISKDTQPHSGPDTRDGRDTPERRDRRDSLERRDRGDSMERRVRRDSLERRDRRDSLDRKRDSLERRRDSLERKDRRGSSSERKLENITPEEAKERLLREYEKKGISREEARKALINELIKSGVPPEEARQRFSNIRSSSDKRRRNDRYRSRSRSLERGLPKSYSSDRRGESYKSHKAKRALSPPDKKDRKNRRSSGKEAHEKNVLSKDELKSIYRDAGPPLPQHTYPKVETLPSSAPSTSRPALTLGEMLGMKKKRLANQRFSTEEAAAKQTDSQPGPSAPPPKPDLSNMLQTLTSSLISSEDDESMANQVSKALSSALLKYRMKTVTKEEAKPAATDNQSFVEKCKEDAKKLFHSKLQPGPSSSQPQSNPRHYTQQSARHKPY